MEPAGRGERKMGLRWRLICEGRLVWFVLAESKGGAENPRGGVGCESGRGTGDRESLPTAVGKKKMIKILFCGVAGDEKK